MNTPAQVHDAVVVKREDLSQLVVTLQDDNYTVIGPTVRDEAIIYDELRSLSDLPIGWTDEQKAGSYRLKRREDKALFGYVVGPHSWKKFLHPPRLRLWQAKRDGRSFQVIEEQEETPKYAFFGMRPCEIHAMAIQDRVFMGDHYTDSVYKSRREQVFIVAVNCGQAGGTCFCTSMGTGPKATIGFDLALTEVLSDDDHCFVIEIGSELGAVVMGSVPHQVAGEQHKKTVAAISADTAAQMGRSMDLTDIRDLLYHNREHPRWDAVADRCLACANCTMVCPTCFCSTVEDTTDLTGDHAERWRRWDSCFTMDFSYIQGGSVRSSTKARYRQWMTHKLAAWIDQFGTSGCVGCGRCITWCPVEIDITEEVAAIRSSDSRKEPPDKES